MAPKRESHEDRSVRFQKRALEESLKGLHHRCVDAMRARPDLLGQIYRVLQSAKAIPDDAMLNQQFGIKTEDAGDNPITPIKTSIADVVPFAPALTTTEDEASSRSDTTSLQDTPKMSSPLNALCSHRNYSSLQSTPIKVLQAVLTDIEPVVFSGPHQKQGILLARVSVLNCFGIEGIQ